MSQRQPERARFAGLMSGTSLDGVDVAVVSFHDAEPEVLAFETYPYPKELQGKLRWLCEAGDVLAMDALHGMDRVLGRHYAECLHRLLKTSRTADCGLAAIGCHGQTIRHRPRLADGYSAQLGCGATLATETGCVVVNDFRRADIAAGGGGAPLAPAFHQQAFSDRDTNRIVLNLGGIANVTFLPATGNAGTVRGFDTGPANTLCDWWAQETMAMAYDRGGAQASQGQVVEPLLGRLLADPYFAEAAPKSTGTDTFNSRWVLERFPSLRSLAPADVQATLVELTARTIADAINAEFGPELTSTMATELLVCGGGAHNAFMLRRIADHTGLRLATTEAFGVHPDAVEAVAFAWLAYRRLAGLASNLPSVTGAKALVSLGVVHLPAES